mmetsp:Transcript_43988/g.138261  ORF Transcript_43988/g.138261 Transcript_43988/m.138261 type:complete len:158 (-) Transcript_43988:194-667(-)
MTLFRGMDQAARDAEGIAVEPSARVFVPSTSPSFRSGGPQSLCFMDAAAAAQFMPLLLSMQVVQSKTLQLDAAQSSAVFGGGDLSRAGVKHWKDVCNSGARILGVELEGSGEDVQRFVAASDVPASALAETGGLYLVPDAAVGGLVNSFFEVWQEEV